MPQVTSDMLGEEDEPTTSRRGEENLTTDAVGEEGGGDVIEQASVVDPFGAF